MTAPTASAVPAHAVPLGATELVDVGGRRLNVWRAGDTGPVVLLCHGIPTNHLLWPDGVPRLAEHARVVAVDMLGYGWSDAPDGWRVDIAAQASYLLRLLDALDVERVAVVGHDLGGGVAQILAVTASDRVAGIGVIDGVCYDGWPVPVAKALVASWPLLRRLPPDRATRLLEPGLRRLFLDQERASLFLPRFLAPFSAPDGMRRFTDHLRALDPVLTETVAPFLPRLRLPVEITWGRADDQMKLRFGERLAGDIPDARLTVVDAHHFVPADAPTAAVDTGLRLLDRLDA